MNEENIKRSDKKENIKDPKYSVAKSLRYMFSTAWKTSKSVILICLIIAFVQVATNMANLYIAPKILEKVEASAPIGELLATIAVFTGILFLLSGINYYLNWSLFMGRVTVRVAILNEINKKSFTTSYPNLFDADRKALLGKSLKETDGNSESTEHIWTTLTELLVNIACFVLYLITLSGIDPLLIIISIVTCILASTIRMWALGKYRNSHEQGDYWNKFYYYKSRAESVQTAKDIRIFGLEKWIRELYGDVLRLQAAFIRKRESYLVFSAAFGVIMTFLQNGVAYAYLLKTVIEGGLSASEFLLYFTAISGFTAWVTGILENCNTIYQESQGIGSVLAYIEGDEQFRFEGGRPIPDTDKYELKLENVTFSYPGTEKALFEDLNLTIHPGEKLAVVGLNGAGKTTLVKLLCGFFDPTEGKVTLNGIDIREFNRQDYYKLLCAVYQEFSVLDMTVAENVAQSADDIDVERVWHCLEMAGLDGFIRTLPDGLDSHVGRDVYLDGTLFSGGQTQRLMLARALYKDGPILVLDEPTAALDPIAESDIYKKYNEMSGSKTSIFISHRLASTRFCDRIIFISEGKITEVGTHEELVARGGEYAALFEVQSQYYQEGADFRGK